MLVHGLARGTANGRSGGEGGRHEAKPRLRLVIFCHPPGGGRSRLHAPARRCEAQVTLSGVLSSRGDDDRRSPGGPRSRGTPATRTPRDSGRPPDDARGRRSTRSRRGAQRRRHERDHALEACRQLATTERDRPVVLMAVRPRTAPKFSGHVYRRSPSSARCSPRHARPPGEGTSASAMIEPARRPRAAAGGSVGDQQREGRRG